MNNAIKFNIQEIVRNVCLCGLMKWWICCKQHKFSSHKLCSLILIIQIHIKAFSYKTPKKPYTWCTLCKVMWNYVYCLSLHSTPKYHYPFRYVPLLDHLQMDGLLSCLNLWQEICVQVASRTFCDSPCMEEK